MSAQRWYPSATVLRNGRVLVSSGHKYKQLWFWGGRRNGLVPKWITGDSLYRYGTVSGGQVDPAVLPETLSGVTRPKPTEGHSIAPLAGVGGKGTQAFFGGRDSTGNPVSATFVYALRRESPATTSDYGYRWSRIEVSSTVPDARSHHIACGLSETEMVIFGGLGGNTGSEVLVPNDLWRLFLDPSPPAAWKWQQVTQSGTRPSARYGHTAVYDTARRRIILFGGAEGFNQAPTDRKIWIFDFDSNFSSGQWSSYPVPVDSTWPWGLLNHTMTLEPADDPTKQAIFLYGGDRGSASYSDTLWKLTFNSDSTPKRWERIALSGNVPGRRSRHGVGWDNIVKRLFVFGGDSTGGAQDKSVYMIDLSGSGTRPSSKWATMPFHLSGHSALLDPYDYVFARTPEIYDPGTNSWSTNTTASLDETYYPLHFVVPGGSGGATRVVSVGQNSQGYWNDIPASGAPSTAWQTMTAVSGFSPLTGVMYEPGKILIAGGKAGGITGTTKSLDATSMSNQWVSLDAMEARYYHNLVLLPTGKVLALGGVQTEFGGDTTGPVRRPQIRDPRPDSSWSSMTSDTWLAVASPLRNYHSTAVLLPDGRVLCAGGSDSEAMPNLAKDSANIFCPPYLFRSNGSGITVRPQISGAPDSVAWGALSTYTLNVADTTGIKRACLIRAGATTHAFDQSQRYVPIPPFTVATNPTRLLFTAPATADHAPPGDYLLFLVGSTDGPDVPSIARWVRTADAGQDGSDTITPAQADDITAECDPNSSNGWIVTWTTPADDGSLAASGRVRAYDLRKRSARITNDSTWALATKIAQTPGVPGTVHTYATQVSGTSYMRLKSVDDANHLTSMSAEIALVPWTSQGGDCPGGEGLWGGGGGGGGSALRRGATSATLGNASENSLLNGAAPGAPGRDVFRLSGVLAGGSTLPVYLHERAGRGASLDGARLYVVDHEARTSAYRVGDSFVSGTPQCAIQITASAGGDVTDTLDGSSSFTVTSTDTLTVDLGSGGGSSPLLVRGKGRGTLTVQVPDGRGGWNAAGSVRLRVREDELALAAPQSDSFRLLCDGYAVLRFVGRIAVSGSPTVQQATLLGAQNAAEEDVTSVVGTADSVGTELIGPDTLHLSFALPAATGGARDCFLMVDATLLDPETLGGSRLAPMRESAPVRFALWPNRPNPFAATTTLRFDLPVGSMVRLEVFDPQGRRIETLANRYFPAGVHRVVWTPGARSSRIGPGVYFYRIEAGSYQARRKTVLLP